MELRHLHYFLAVAEELNFSRAAERLHIAQPPLSQQIRDLEAELGVTLFERTKRQVKLTNAGQVFLEEVQQALQQVDRAVDSARQAGRGELGRLMIGFNSSATYSVLPDLLYHFRQSHPNVELVLHELTTSQQIEKLYNSQIDVGLLYLPLENDELSTLSVLKEPLVLAMPETHPLSTQSQVSMQSLRNELFILPPHQLGEALYRQIMNLFEQLGFVPQKVQQAVQLQTVISLVAGSVGVAIVPASLQNLQRMGVVYKYLQEYTSEVEIAAAWRQGDTSPILHKFLASVQVVASAHPLSIPLPK